jgi:dTDP-glucose 4,6-dehydratase
LELVDLILNKMGFDTSRIEKVPDRPGHDFRYSVDFSKASKFLSYSPLVKLQDGIQETINWYCENKSWWENSLKA